MDSLARTDRVKKIAELNDTFRASMTGGRVIVTAGVAALDVDARIALLKEVRSFSAFTSDNDPYGEHDFGSVSVRGHDFSWKIDLYEDPNVKDGNGEPAVMRVLTIMLTEEY
jgi:hypothetical protein